MNSQFPTHTELIAHLSQCSWKEKISFFDQISQSITSGKPQLPPKILEQSWIKLLNEKNINILFKIIGCLKHFTQHFALHNLRAQKQMIRKLLALTKMKKKQLNDNIGQIIYSLITKEKQTANRNQRLPIHILPHQLFCKVNNPTFLSGNTNQGKTEEKSPQDLSNSFEPTSQTEIPYSNSYLLQYLLQIMKGCGTQIFFVILDVASKLKSNSLLIEHEIKQLCQLIISIKEVILKRRNAEQTKSRQLQVKVESVLAILISNQWND